MTARAIRFGLIGCGDIGVVRAAALAKARHQLSAVSDTDKAKMSAAAKGRAVHCLEWRALVGRDDVDAVIAATPPALHAEMTVAALRAGNHVLCEKPLARDPAECAAMNSETRDTGRILATGFNYRFYPSFRRARDWLDAGRIGELSHVRSYGGYSAASHAQQWVHDGAIAGGGALHDIGIHLLDLTRWFLGDVENVQGLSTGGVWNFPGCEDNGFALLRGPSGRVATVHASWTEWGRYQFCVELVGRSGRIRASCFPMRAELLESDAPGSRTRRTVERFPRVFVGEHLRSYRWVVRESFVAELSEFVRAIQGEASAIATGEDGARALEIAHGCRAIPLAGEAAGRE
jgi:predicted dehydrogenase